MPLSRYDNRVKILWYLWGFLNRSSAFAITMQAQCVIMLMTRATDAYSVPAVVMRSSHLPVSTVNGVSPKNLQMVWYGVADRKGESIWDRMLHEHPEYGTNGDNGDVACDSYHKYQEDVQMLKAINVTDVYRFSIAWTRILPTGDLDVINLPGIDYYNNLINELLANGIQPLVTMYHWDLPQALQYIGGWPNPILDDYFVEYARVLFENFGDRVKMWTTFNEPEVFTTGYASAEFQAPSQSTPGIGDYLAAHTVIRAHGLVYRLYQEQFRAKQNGTVGITLNITGRRPASNSSEDLEAVERKYQFDVGLYAHPIFSQEGDYPAVVRQRVDANSAAEGRPRSRLPTFTQEEIEYLRGLQKQPGLNGQRGGEDRRVSGRFGSCQQVRADGACSPGSRPPFHPNLTTSKPPYWWVNSDQTGSGLQFRRKTTSGRKPRTARLDLVLLEIAGGTRKIRRGQASEECAPAPGAACQRKRDRTPNRAVQSQNEANQRERAAAGAIAAGATDGRGHVAVPLGNGCRAAGNDMEQGQSSARARKSAWRATWLL
ncbi:myrosinase 1-like [Schistocerca piceifrons]|uniref:myrosinase 1-like n=1 Tax=Schistocerca piceifrons TaxID=274613 RepID=UPI001F5F1BC3|nr:myrosinase 1-like [Schistocerca piceifrons]